MSQIEVEPDDRELMLATLKDTPPITDLFAGTDDQRSEIWLQKQRNLFLREKLKAYFNGQAELNIEGLNQFDQDSLELEKDKLLAFYALIQGSWGEIIQLAESANVRFSDSGIHQPGELIAGLIESQSADMVKRLTSPYFRFTPSASRKQIKALKDAQKLMNQKRYEDMRAPEKRKVDRAMTETAQINAESGSSIALSFVLNCCRELVKGSSTHSAIRRRLEAYNAVSAKCFKLTNSQLHPRKGVRGWEMVKGRKQFMGTSGGVASD